VNDEAILLTVANDLPFLFYHMASVCLAVTQATCGYAAGSGLQQQQQWQP